MYKINFTETSIQDILKLRKSDPQAFKKLGKLLKELEVHPTKGTSHPKPLSQDRVNQWSRKISNKHRLVYLIEEEEIIVLILSAYGHYDDK